MSGPNRSKLQDMLANLRDVEDLSHMQPPAAPQARPSVPRLNEHEASRPDEGQFGLGPQWVRCHVHIYNSVKKIKFRKTLFFPGRELHLWSDTYKQDILRQYLLVGVEVWLGTIDC